MDDHISPRLVIRALNRRFPQAAAILRAHGLDPAQSHLSIELAARASGRDPAAVIADLRAALRPAA
jgi:hypothetical protein